MGRGTGGEACEVESQGQGDGVRRRRSKGREHTGDRNEPPDRATDMNARATTDGKAARAATATHPAAGTGDACRRSPGSVTGRAGDVPAADNLPPVLYCNRCGHLWRARTGGTPPRKCPACDSPYWNIPARTCHCLNPKCRHIWTARNGHKPSRCPICHGKKYAFGNVPRIEYMASDIRQKWEQSITDEERKRRRLERERKRRKK